MLRLGIKTPRNLKYQLFKPNRKYNVIISFNTSILRCSITLNNRTFIIFIETY